MNLKLRFLLLGAVLLSVGACWVVLWPAYQSSSYGESPEIRKNSTDFADVAPATSGPPSNSRESNRDILGALEKILSAPAMLDHGGPLELSRSELFLRQDDGIERIVSFPIVPDASSLLAQISKIRAETGLEPNLVFYPPIAPRTELSRRIATRDILISAPTREAADSLAKPYGLEFKSAPSYAPGRFVYSAKNSVEALAFHLQSASADNARTTPLLASRVQKMSSFPNDRYFQKQWHLAFQNQLGAEPNTDINVVDLWKYPSTNPAEYNRGQGVTIAIVDDGLEWNHPDLAPNMRNNLGRNWNDGAPFDPYPNYFLDDSHGTACAGVAAARGNNNLGVSGVAPEASLVGMRLISGLIGDLEISESIIWQNEEIQVKSNSWGDPVPLFPVGELTQAALKHATDFGREGKGTIITFAAANDDLIGQRADYKALQNSMHTIAVGAVSSRGVKSDYSARGACLVISAPSNTLIAPGLGIMTTDNRGKFGYNRGTFIIPGMPYGNDFLSDPDVTQRFGGTSSACPKVSGVIALMLHENPNLGWRDVQEILMRSAAKVDVNDPEWITANRTDHVTGNKTIQFHFNHKYGAGLVDAAAAVALASSWKNLGGQLSKTYAANQSLPISIPDCDSAGGSLTFDVNGPNLRVEHVILRLSVSDVPMSQLKVKLKSPAGTKSIFCEVHTNRFGDVFFTDWSFNTVRHWAEDSTGNWTLTVADRCTGQTGNITAAELTIYGTTGTGNPPPNVNLTASSQWVFRGTPVTINASAIDLQADSTPGTVESIVISTNQSLSPPSPPQTGSSASWTWTPSASGNYIFTVNATDSQGAFRVSAPIKIRVDAPLIAGWDFETLTANQSSTALNTAIQTSRTYSANFGRNNGVVASLLFNGSNGSSRWEHGNGEIWTGFGSDLNLGPGFANSSTSPNGLLLRGGKNLSGNGKALVFRFDMTTNRRLRVSYVTGSTSGGFTSQAWEYSTDGSSWTPVQTVAPPLGKFETINLHQIAGLNNAPNAFLRVRFSGATQVDGFSLMDNIRLNATPTP